MPDTVKLRDFLYMDVDRLYSLYSQVFEGVVGQIQRVKSSQGTNKNIQQGRSGKATEELAAETSEETRNSVLHDHLYTQLEDRLNPSIFYPDGITPQNFRALLKDKFLIKVKGKAEIEDYARLADFALHFNDTMGAITYAGSSQEVSLYREQVEAQTQQLREDLRAAAKTQRSQVHRQLRELNEHQAFLHNPQAVKAALLQNSGNAVDPELISALTLIINRYYPNGYEVTILPEDASGNLGFRGVLDKQWLRLAPEYIRTLYGGFVERELTMVGQVTYLPRLDTEIETALQNEGPETAQQDSLATDEPKQEDTTPKSMRDAVWGMSRSSSELEKMFFDSKKRIEILVRPLAIYQEIEVNTSET